MKIAYVTADHGTSVFGEKGASVHIQEMTKAFDSLDHQLSILAANLGTAPERHFAKLIKVTPDPSTYVETDQENNPGSPRIVKEKRYLNVSERMHQRLVSLYQEGPFDFIYERYSLWSTAGVRAARELGVPSIIEVNAPLVLEQQRYRELALAEEAQAIEAEVFKNAGVLAAVSSEMADYIIDKGGDPARVVVIPNAVDTSRFNPEVKAASLGIPKDALVIGFVGSLKAWHGIEVLMDAFRLLCEQSPSYHLLIVGDGPLRGWVEGFAQGARLADRITLTAWVDYQDLPNYIKAMDIAVAPYPMLDDFYFSPLKLYEYLAVGIPVVASDIGQIPEVIKNGVTGMLVRPGDAADLAEKIEQMRREPDVRLQMGSAAVHQAQGHTWESNAQRIIDLAQAFIHGH